jgi:hypothetical protein
MDDLIKALQILRKYTDLLYPTHCEHDVLYICVDPEIVSNEDKKELDSLGFDVDENEGCFYSFKYGSC